MGNSIDHLFRQIRCFIWLASGIAILLGGQFIAVGETVAAQDGEPVLAALRRFESSFQGYRVEYSVLNGKFDLPKPKLLHNWEGILIWDQQGQKQIEYHEFPEPINLPEGYEQWERSATFVGRDFRVGLGESSDSGGSGAIGYVKTNGEDPNRPWWSNCALGVVTLNSEDDRILTLADVLEKFHFLGTEKSGENLAYRFENSTYGDYTVELDDANRIAGIKIIKMPSHRWKQQISIDTPPWTSRKLEVTFTDFEYDAESNVCTQWRRIAEFWPKSAEKSQQLEWRYNAKSVSKTETLDRSDIHFETMTMTDGAKISIQDDPGIEYIWSDNQIVRVVDAGTLQTVDGSEFVPARRSETMIMVLIACAVCLLLLTAAIRYRFKSK